MSGDETDAVPWPCSCARERESWEEPSMDQCPRGNFQETFRNFQGHWSVRVSGNYFPLKPGATVWTNTLSRGQPIRTSLEICMDQLATALKDL